MMKFTLLVVLLLGIQDVYGRCTGDKWCCKGQCGQGEGDCDEDSNCLPGLKCDFDGWFGTDYCVAGPDTRNFDWSEWSDWSECSVACGGVGTQSRSRSCNPPKNGGFPCPFDTDSETQECDNGPCPVDGGLSDWDEWGACTEPCGGGDQTRSRRCDNPSPQFGGADCIGELFECQRCNMDPCSSHCPV